MRLTCAWVCCRRCVCCVQAAGVDRVDVVDVFNSAIAPPFVMVLVLVCPPHAFARVVVPLYVDDPWLEYLWFR